jgi:hypothetical protein
MTRRAQLHQHSAEKPVSIFAGNDNGLWRVKKTFCGVASARNLAEFLMASLCIFPEARDDVR